MTPVSLPATMVRRLIPDFSGPTSWLITQGQACGRSNRSAFHRHVATRLACISLIATAALEALVHATLLIATVPMIVVKRVIWMTLIGTSMIAGWLFWMVHGDTLSVSVSVWIKRIVIHVVLFLREPSVVFNHLKVWSGLTFDHLVATRKLTAYALNVQHELHRYFSIDHVMHHGHQLAHLTGIAVLSLFVGLLSPSAVCDFGSHVGLGPMQRPPLIQRAWSQIPSGWEITGRVAAKSLVFIGDHFFKIMLAMTTFAVYRDFQYQKDGISGYLFNIPQRTWEMGTTALGGSRKTQIDLEELRKLIELLKKES